MFQTTGFEDLWWAYSLPISLLVKHLPCDTWAFATQRVLDPLMRHYSCMHILQARLLDEARGGCPVPQSRPKWAGDPCGKRQYFYFLTSSKFSFPRSVYNTVQKWVWKMPTEQPFLLMCDFHRHIGWYLLAHTLLGLALTCTC